MLNKTWLCSLPSVSFSYMWDVGSLSTSPVRTGITFRRNLTCCELLFNILWMLPSYLTHCIVLKVRVEKEGLLSAVSTVPSAHKYSVGFILIVPPWSIQCPLWLELVGSINFLLCLGIYLSEVIFPVRMLKVWLPVVLLSDMNGKGVRTRIILGLFASSNICSKGRSYRKQSSLQ